MDRVKRSKKSRMKKRPEDWEAMKQEIAKELGLWDKAYVIKYHLQHPLREFPAPADRFPF